MQVCDVMTREVESVTPDSSLQQDGDGRWAWGSPPVCDGRRLDAAVLARMSILQVRRLAALDHDRDLVGIVALGDIATEPHSLRAAK
jgi:hypothetical protein